MMNKLDLSQFRHKRVVVIDAYGETYTGKVNLFTAAKDNDTNEDAIALDCGVWLDESDIKEIKEV